MSNADYLKASRQKTVFGNRREGNYQILNSKITNRESSPERVALVDELLTDDIPPPIGI